MYNKFVLQLNKAFGMKKNDLYKQTEPSIKQSLKYFADKLNSLKFINFIFKNEQDYDDIHFFQYFSEVSFNPQDTDGHILIKDTRPGGSSLFSEELALLKCLGETAERIYYNEN